MDFRTIVNIDKPQFRIEPCERMLFVGSCFADNIGRKFVEEKFRAVVNPRGVMYNPASILHTVEQYDGEAPSTAMLTLGTNHVYILRSTGEIVDNCNKKPQRLFEERELTIAECTDYLAQTVQHLRSVNPQIRVIITVSPIRYAKYGYHGSALSKATLLLAADKLAHNYADCVTYFPAYEIVNDELRDYRFYQEDMLHPSAQAVEYIWQRFTEVFLSDAAKLFLEEWKPIKEALGHRPFNPDSEEYKAFMQKTMEKAAALKVKYPDLEL
jgi:lysophospholipase L1-like esterase